MTTPPCLPRPLPGHRWSLREDVVVEDIVEGEPDAVAVHTPWRTIRLDRPGRAVRESLRRMTLGPIRLQNVPVAPAGESVAAECRRLSQMVDRLSCAVVHSFVAPGGHGPFLSVVPVSPLAHFLLERVAPRATLRLVPSTVLRADCAVPALATREPRFEVLLERPSARSLPGLLQTSATVRDLAERLGIAETVAADAVAFLVAAGIVVVDSGTDPAR